MELQHINVKIFIDGDPRVDLEQFIQAFHRWTAAQQFDELLIDVADYRHVPNGPGVVLVGHEADYAIDNAGGRWGLLYNRKASLGGTNEDRLRQAFAAAANACQLLETEFAAESLQFSRQDFALFINDRALAPNTSETLEQARPVMESFLKTLGEFKIDHQADPRKRFGVEVTLSTPFEMAQFAAAPAS